MPAGPPIHGIVHYALRHDAAGTNCFHLGDPR